MDDLASGLASVKLAMSGDKRNEVINLLTQLLQEAVEVGPPARLQSPRPALRPV